MPLSGRSLLLVYWQVCIALDRIFESECTFVCFVKGVVFLKFCLWVYCRQFTHSPIAQALAQDHINDVYSNAIALVVIFIASYLPHLSYLDPAGAICISLWIIWSWYSTGKEEVKIVDMCTGL